MAELFITYTYRPTSLNAESIRRFLRPIKNCEAILGAKNVGEGSQDKHFILIIISARTPSRFSGEAYTGN
ncbi:MAG: hypothetical protein LBG94_10980 [Treponema sp.]|nr:hypothetical protein [Treponema sp.]